MTGEAVSSEFDRIDPQNTIVTLSNGLEVAVLPLKTRQFFKLARIITHGGMNVLDSFLMTTDSNDDEFATQLMALIIFSVPEAGDQAIEFIQSMCAPTNLTGDGKKDKPAWSQYNEVMENPSLDDTLSILEVIVKVEGPELKALGKRLMAAVKTMTPQTPQIEVVKTETTETPEVPEPEKVQVGS